jgi:hypothetical protein
MMQEWKELKRKRCEIIFHLMFKFNSSERQLNSIS